MSTPTVTAEKFPHVTVSPLSKDTAEKIINMQKSIEDNLKILLERQRFMLSNNGDETTPTSTLESFVNVGSIMLNPETYPEVSDYSDVYNENVALLDDPRNMINSSFNTYINIQDKRLAKLRNQLYKLQDDIQSNKINPTLIKGFKSMNNSQILNVEPYNDINYTPMPTNYPSNTIYSTTNPNTTNPNTTKPNKTKPNTKKPSNIQVNGASQYPNYLIYGNNGCLEYEPSTTDLEDYITPASWAFKPCNANDPRQQFVSKQINDLPTYNSYITDPNNASSILRGSKTTTFGFNIVNPINNQDQCLQLDNKGVAIMPCHLEFEQRFRPLYKTVLP